MRTVTPEQLQNGSKTLLTGLALVLVAVPFVIDDTSLLRILTFTFVWSGFAVAWNLFSGYSGYISFGHAIFFGIGAFTNMYILTGYDVTPWIGMIVGALLAAVAGVLIGIITLRALSGIYFALSMLAVTLIAQPLVTWLGFVEVSLPYDPNRQWYYMSFRGLTEYYLIAFALMIVTLVAAWAVKNSRMGYYLNAIKGSEPAARSLGVNTYRYEIYALAISGFFSGLFGTLYMQTNFIFTSQSAFGLNTLIQPVVLSIAGGIGTLFGPIVGGFILYPLAELLRGQLGAIIPGIHNIVYGIMLIVIIIYLPDGILPGLRSYVENRFVDGSGEEPAAVTETEETFE